jgi:hypothetical protein
LTARKYYLAGPMTGLPEYNFPAFDEAAQLLRAWGFDVLSAHEVDHGETPESRGKTKGYFDYLRASIFVLLKCNTIILLPGWRDSRGCQAEYYVARTLGMDRYEYHTPPSPEKPYIRQIT